jgi:16S rRNA (guanine966-N2)-methyltransferase
MRIVGGEFKKKSIKVPKNGVRPTTGRVREMVFNSLGAKVNQARFLDLFSGSGAVGLEAYSWGAASVQFVEQNRASFSILKQNVTNFLNSAGLDCFCMDVFRFLERPPSNEKYDIVFADPPYADGLMEKTLNALVKADLVAENGVVIFELDGSDRSEPGGDWRVIKEKGGSRTSTRLIFMTRA